MIFLLDLLLLYLLFRATSKLFGAKGIAWLLILLSSYVFAVAISFANVLFLLIGCFLLWQTVGTWKYAYTIKPAEKKSQQDD